MISGLEAGQSHNPSEDRQIQNGLTHEDLVRLVGSDYRQLISGALVSLNVIQGEDELNFQSPTGIHKRSNGQESNGHYIVEQIIGDHRVYAYLLKPERSESGEPIGKTSEHKHEHPEIDVSEYYLLLRGAMRLMLEEEDSGQVSSIELDSDRNPHFVVSPRTYHQAEITDGVALVLVIMPDAAQIPDERLHIPRPQTAA